MKCSTLIYVLILWTHKRRKRSKNSPPSLIVSLHRWSNLHFPPGCKKNIQLQVASNVILQVSVYLFWTSLWSINIIWHGCKGNSLQVQDALMRFCDNRKGVFLGPHFWYFKMNNFLRMEAACWSNVKIKSQFFFLSLLCFLLPSLFVMII